MPQLAFVQVMAVAAFAAILAVVLAMPVSARLGHRAGGAVLRTSLIGVLLVFAGSLVWGSSTGDLGRFNAREGTSAWLQLGAFFGIVYGTGYRFVSMYIADKAARAAEAGGAAVAAEEGDADA